MRSEAVKLNDSADIAHHDDASWKRMVLIAEAGNSAMHVAAGKMPANINQRPHGVLGQIAMYRALKRSGQI